MFVLRSFVLIWLPVLCVFVLLILLALSFADNGFDDEDDAFSSALNDGDSVGSVGSVDDGASTSVDLIVDVQLLNSSFEDGTEAPTNWTSLSLELDFTYRLDTEVSSKDKRSVLIVGTRFDYGRWQSDAISVAQDGFNWYTLTADVKTQANDGEVYLALAWFDKAGVLRTTSDSLMLPIADNDWQSVTLNALPPAGAKTLSVWCISNNNDGYAWFDNITLQRTQLPSQGAVSYDRFLIEHPNSPLALDAHNMRVKSLMTDAKWIREDGFYDPQAQLRASLLYAEAAKIVRDDSVLGAVGTVTDGDFAAEKQAFEALIDQALWEASVTAKNGGDTTAARGYLSKIVQRNQDPDLTETAKQFIEDIDALGYVND